MTARIYVGLSCTATALFEVFRSKREPTEKEFGERFGAVVGPFRTKRGAEFFAAHSLGNPHISCVDDAERIARDIARLETFQPGARFRDKRTGRIGTVRAWQDGGASQWFYGECDGETRKGVDGRAYAELFHISHVDAPKE